MSEPTIAELKAKIAELREDKDRIIDLIEEACKLPPVSAVKTLKAAVAVARHLKSK